MSFDDDLDAELDREKDFAILDVLVNKNIRTLRFTEMDGLAWADITDRCPMRVGAKVDEGYGYDIRKAVALAGPKCTEVQDGDDWVKVTDEQWTKLLRGLTGAYVRAVGDQLFMLNQWGPAQAVIDAKKALAVESVKNLSSPAPSESPAPA